MFRGRAVLAVLIFTCVAPALALARPDVKVHLTGALVQKNTKGQISTAPIGGLTLHAGQIILYTIEATNAGSDAAFDFSTDGAVPARTRFVGGSVSAPPATVVEYSLDGKTWSAHPTVALRTPHGVVRRPASASQYVRVRFAAKRPLAPKASFRYSYEVLVK